MGPVSSIGGPIALVITPLVEVLGVPVSAGVVALVGTVVLLVLPGLSAFFHARASEVRERGQSV